MNLTGKVTLVTGASRGIGRQIALTLAGYGATVIVTGLELHLRKQTVKWQGQPLHLTHLEFFTLAYLARHPGWIFTQEQIYEAVWHEFPEDCGAAVVNIISQLRRKMGPGNPIRTVPHSGYKFELPSAD